MLEAEFDDLATAISCWLTYRSITGRRLYLDESSITDPVVEFYQGKVERERPNPKSKVMLGRKNPIDFYIPNAPPIFMEVKFLKGPPRASTNPFYVIQDVAKLAALSGGRRLITIAAEKAISQLTYKGHELFSEVLKKDAEASLDFGNWHSPLKDLFESACTNLGSSDLPLSISSTES
ncbi:MAG: hypothetical protein ACR2K5_12760 [Pseudolabrys sp.]